MGTCRSDVEPDETLRLRSSAGYTAGLPGGIDRQHETKAVPAGVFPSHLPRVPQSGRRIANIFVI
jgi:hypothetical protein